jgi:tRNA/rRNA methyltransferase
MSLDRCRVVLVRTHYPGNLGATARIMCNLGLRDLVLVSPVADVNDRNARQMSTHGEHILDNARAVDDLGAAVGVCAVVVGTSAPTAGLYRKQTVGTPAEVLRHLVEPLQRNAQVAVVFGSEPNGLTNDEVTRCHYLINIPTAEEYGSLNLAQAVAICLYELRNQWLAAPAPLIDEPESLATFAEQERLFEQLRQALEEIHFLYGDKAEPLMHAVRHLLGKARLTTQEVKILLGLARQIRWYVANHPRTIADDEHHNDA